MIPLMEWMTHYQLMMPGHKALKLLAFLTLQRVQSFLSWSNFPLGKELCSFQHKWTWKHHLLGKGLAFHPEYVCSYLAGFPGLHHCFSSGFLLSPNEAKTAHHCDLILIVLLFCTCRWPFQRMHSRIICLGRKCFVDKKVGAFSQL